MTDHPNVDRSSVPAILAYICLAQIGIFGMMLFWVVIKKIHLDAVVVGLLGSFFTSIFSNASLALGYHLGASVGGKTANAALAQIAGAGPPPPAQPLADDSAAKTNAV